MTLLALNLAALGAPDFWIGVGIVAGIYSIFTLGLQLNVGFTGLFNFGQAGFMAVGAYAMAILILSFGWPPLVALPAATGIAVVAGVIVGIPSIRLSGDYLAMATLAAAQIVGSVVQNAGGLTGGNQGLLGFDANWTVFAGWLLARLSAVGLGGESQMPLFVVTWLTFGLLQVSLRLVLHSPWGRVLRAIREDEAAAEALGKNTYAYKLQSLGIAAALGAIAGYLLALNVTLIYPQAFSADFTFIGFAILVLGGLGSFAGVAWGSILLWTVLEGASFVQLPIAADRVAAVRMLIVGLVLIGVMVLRPQGLLGKRQEMILRG
ncbi:MAG TPA: branched-chain amino acid ABC transporter permease [bacterium]|nr:branched-chain amino acid ABC transporter permease [bacterium]